MPVSNVLMNFSRTMPESGSGLRDFAKNRYLIKQQEQENALARTKEAREQGKDDREQQAELAKRWAGVAGWADTPEKWAQAQQGGYLPKELSYETREPFIMGVMTESERLNREKHSYTKEEDKRKAGMEERKFGLEQEKFGETKRKNRADERKAVARGSDASGDLKAADENYIAKSVANLFDGIYDVETGRIQLKDDESRRKAQRIIASATRLYANNPNITRSQAVSEAAKREGIDVGFYSEPGTPGINPTAGPAGGAQFNYVPGQGLIPAR